MAKFKKNQVVWDKLLNQGTSIIAIAPTGVVRSLPAGVTVYRCYENEPEYGSYRLDDELRVTEGEQPLEPEVL